MSSKAKKLSASVWYTCEACQYIISRKDMQEHLKHCLVTGDAEIDECKRPFIKNSMLYSTIEDCKQTGIPTVSEDLVLVSQSAMQICQFIIGDFVTVQTKHVKDCSVDCNVSHCEVKTIWPTNEGSVTSVFCPKQGMDLSWGLNYGPCIISKLQAPPMMASEVTFNVINGTEIPEKIDHFIKVIQCHLSEKVLHLNSRTAVNFYGKKFKLIISNIKALKDNEFKTSVDTLVTELSELRTNDVIKFYKCDENTKWLLKDYINPASKEELASHSVTLDDIGGYEKIVNELREFVTKEVNQSTTAHRKNIISATGVLLYGLHGTGKSLLAQALANCSGSHVVNIHSGDLFSKFYGEAEARLKSLFKEALSHSPSIIILDDIDTICSKRSGSDQERRVIATLLASLDLLHGSDVIVIATTSQIHVLDSALRRPGRLDREIEIPVPTQADREDILLKMLKNESDLDKEAVKRTAAVAHGYVGADLGAVVASAYSRAAHCSSNTITDFLDWALLQIKPSAMREVYVEVPNVKWSDIGGQDHLKLQLQQAVQWPLTHPEAFTRLGITPPHGVLMFGPPGCSKTMIAKALATESKLNFISIKGPELFSKWVGESERAVRSVFKRARSVAPSIVFLDELDALAGERSDGSTGGGASVQERVLAQLLTELDGVEPLSNVTIIAATNRPDRIDKALLRPGRLDRLIYVPLPNTAARRQIFELQFKKIPVANDVDLDYMTAATDKYSGAEVVAVCHEAAMNALEEDYQATQVKFENFKYALSIVTPRTSQTLLELYDAYTAR